MTTDVTLSNLLRLQHVAELWRFYQAAVVNTVFGFGTYAFLVWLGVNLYLAQIIAQLAGMTFNYFTYSRHVFRHNSGGKVRFTLIYAVNYMVNVSLLAVFDLFFHSPYLIGALATLCASFINYFALKHLVFVGKDAAA